MVPSSVCTYVLDPDLRGPVRSWKEGRKEGQTLKYRTSKMRLSMNNMDHLTVHMDIPYRDSMAIKDYDTLWLAKTLPSSRGPEDASGVTPTFVNLAIWYTSNWLMW